MGEPLRVGSRAEKYSRVRDRERYRKNLEAIQFPSKGKPRKPGRTTIVWKDGKRIVVREGGKIVNHVELTVRHRRSGVSLYDVLTQPNGPDSEPTQMIDITEAAKAGDVKLPGNDS